MFFQYLGNKVNRLDFIRLVVFMKIKNCINIRSLIVKLVKIKIIFAVKKEPSKRNKKIYVHQEISKTHGIKFASLKSNFEKMVEFVQRIFLCRCSAKSKDTEQISYFFEVWGFKESDSESCVRNIFMHS